MTAVLVFLTCALILAVGLLVHAGTRIEHLQAQVENAPSHDHDECLSHVVWHVRGEFAAVVLRHVADKWDSVENQKVIERMRREWDSSQPGIVTQWLRSQASTWLEAPRP